MPMMLLSEQGERNRIFSVDILLVIKQDTVFIIFKILVDSFV